MTTDSTYRDVSLPFRIRFLHIALLALICALVFSNTLDNDFHLDSVYRVELNTEIDKLYPPWRFFTDVRTGSTIPQIAEYRPLMPLSHAIESKIINIIDGNNRLAGFHIGNIAIHIGSSILAYFLFSILLAGWGPSRYELELHRNHVAFAAALIFAVHPISGSSVNYIAGRDLLLMVFFMLSSFLIYVSMRRHGDSWVGWFFSLLLLSLAILSKQAAIVGFGLVFLFELILKESRLIDWRLWARTALFSLPTLGFFALHSLWIIDQQSDGALRTPLDPLFALTMAKAHLFYYLRNFVWPFEMRALAKFDIVSSYHDLQMLIGATFIITSLAVAYYFRKKIPLFSFSILSYWLLFALTASIFPFRFVVTDYRQYLPSVFLCLLLTLVVCYKMPNRISIAIITTFVLYFSFSSFHLNTHWKTEESFWAQSVKFGGVAVAHANYGLSIGNRDPQLAEKHYLIALEQNPGLVYANINLGMLWINQSKTEAGLALLRKIVDLNPNWALTHYWLSRGLAAAGIDDESLSTIITAADLDSRQLRYQYEAAEALDRNGRRAESIPYLEKIIRINPEFKLAAFRLGFAYQSANKDNARAIELYQGYLGSHPDHSQSHFNLAIALMEEEKCNTAIEHFKRVLELRPKYHEVHLRLSQCYRALGEEKLASSHGKKYKSGQ